MNKELQCNIVNDLLPLYMDDLTSEETNSFIKKHLEAVSYTHLTLPTIA